MIRFLVIFTMLVLLTAVVWSKEKYDPQTLMIKSDALYYYPSTQGLTDMAVDLVIDQLAVNADTKDIKDVKITYYYAGDNRQQFDITNLSVQREEWRPKLLALVAPYTDYLMPKTSLSSFKGLAVKSEKVYRQFLGEPETNYYQLLGSSSDKNAELKELRVLFDRNGLIHELENVMKDGSPVTARVENRRIGDKWQISKISTRLLTETDPVWRIITIDYATVDGFSLPTHIIVQQRGIINQPINGGNLDIHFRNYRINKGVAAAFLPPVKEAPKTEVPVQPSAPTPATKVAPPAKPMSPSTEVKK